MGNGMNKVLPGLFVGNFRDSKDQQQLTEHGITHILSIHDNARKLPCNNDKEYLCIIASDSPGQNLTQFFPVCNDFIHNARIKGGSVLIHCLAGMSRSVTVAVVYVMCVTSLNWRDSLKAVQGARNVANPNVGFMKQLQEFEKERLHDERRRLRDKHSYKSLVEEDEQMSKELLASYYHYISVGEMCEGNCHPGVVCPRGLCHTSRSLGIFRRNSGRENLSPNLGSSTLHRAPSVRETPTSSIVSGSLHRTASSPASMSPEHSPECSRNSSPSMIPFVGPKTITSHMLTPPASPSRYNRKLNVCNTNSLCSTEVTIESPTGNRRSPSSSYGQPTPPGSPSRSFRYYTEPNTPSPLSSPSASFTRVSSSKSLAESPSRKYCNGKVIHCPSHTPPASPMKSCRKRSANNLSQLTPPESPLHFLRNKNKSLQEVGHVSKFVNTPMPPRSKENKGSVSTSCVTAASIKTTLKQNITLRRYKFCQRDVKSLDLSTHEENSCFAGNTPVGQLQSVPASHSKQSSESKPKGSPSRFCQLVIRLLPHLKSLNSSSKLCKHDQKQNSSKSQVSLYVDKEGRSTLISTPDNLSSRLNQEGKINKINDVQVQIGDFQELHGSPAETQVGIFKVCSNIQMLRKDSRPDLNLDLGTSKALFAIDGDIVSNKTSNYSKNLISIGNEANLPSTNIIVNPIFNLESKYITDSLCNEPFKSNDKKISTCTAFLKDDIIYIETTGNDLFPTEIKEHSDINGVKENLNTKKKSEDVNNKTSSECKNFKNNSEDKVSEANLKTKNVIINSKTETVKANLETKNVKTDLKTMNAKGKLEAKDIKGNSETYMKITKVKSNLETKNVKTKLESKNVNTNSDTKKEKTDSETKNIKTNFETKNFKTNSETKKIKINMKTKYIQTSISEDKNTKLYSEEKNKIISDDKNIKIYNTDNLHQEITNESYKHEDWYINYLPNIDNKINLETASYLYQSKQYGCDNKCAIALTPIQIKTDKVIEDKANEVSTVTVQLQKDKKVKKSDVSDNSMVSLKRGFSTLSMEEVSGKKNEENRRGNESLQKEIDRIKITSIENFGKATDVENDGKFQTHNKNCDKSEHVSNKNHELFNDTLALSSKTSVASKDGTMLVQQNHKINEIVSYYEDQKNNDWEGIQPNTRICVNPESGTLFKSSVTDCILLKDIDCPVRLKLQDDVPYEDPFISPTQNSQKLKKNINPLQIAGKTTENKETGCKNEHPTHIADPRSSVEKINLYFQNDGNRQEKITPLLQTLSKEGSMKKEITSHQCLEDNKVLRALQRKYFETDVKQWNNFPSKKTEECKNLESLVDHDNAGTSLILSLDDKIKNFLIKNDDLDEIIDIRHTIKEHISPQIVGNQTNIGIKVTEHSKDSNDNHHQEENKANIINCDVGNKSESLVTAHICNIEENEKNSDSSTKNYEIVESELNCKMKYLVNEFIEKENTLAFLFSDDNERFDDKCKLNDDESFKIFDNSNLCQFENIENENSKLDEFTVSTSKVANQNQKESEMIFRCSSEVPSIVSQIPVRQRFAGCSERKIKGESNQSVSQNSTKKEKESLGIKPKMKSHNDDQSNTKNHTALTKKTDQAYQLNEHSTRPLASSPPPIPPRRNKNLSTKVHATPPLIPPRKGSAPVISLTFRQT